MNHGVKGATEAAAGPRRVLVVDDEASTREYLRRVLEPVYTVHEAADVPSAEAVLAAQPVDVILCDHRMPGECGLDFLARLRRSHPSVVRILITGWTDQEMMLEAINDSAVFRYLVKPVRPGVVQQAVAEALAAGPSAPRPAAPAVASACPTPLTAPERARVAAVASTATLGFTGLLIGLALLAAILLLVVYFLKSGLGIDLFPDMHFRDLFPSSSDAP